MVDITFQFDAFNFDGICKTVQLTLCPIIGRDEGIVPVCYSRNVELADNLIFQPATLIIDVVAIIMVGFMIYHIRSKYTAVGRKEIVMFFYMYLLTLILEMLLLTGIIPISSPVYQWFTAIQLGLITSSWWCLMLNGFVGFQFAEDGTPMSLWSIRLSSLIIFLITGFIAIATFVELGPFSHRSPGALWVFYIIINGVFFITYVISQIVLVLRSLDDRWPLGDILFGFLFFIFGQVLMYIFSVAICDNTKHYIDGAFFNTICTLLAVMMIYKYWDSITKEDLEFSVGAKQNVWEVKELMAEDELSSHRNSMTPLQQQYPPFGRPASGVPMQQYGQQYHNQFD
ncbi:chitin synthase export chaperone [Lichtheimia corymbifera JMRC:FSU:9682]|uniref:Chitin synthase export chaperone n=1 Tax=Lichtheimia corymbifera JMRC:FSU:9682 TaxID=1263082 RepID=A0A068RLG7_9FUNG|nr:chitin synthase export chaperone [Lichtheimia corymbifera JMRC:FSU:9682]